MNDNCIFCKIIKGDIPSYTVYEDEDFKVVLDRFPSSKGHMLVLPKEHVENIFEYNTEKGTKMMEVIKKMATLLREKYNAEGINILQNNGEVAGQSVFHYHVHIIPRYKNDDVKIGWKVQELTDEEIKESYDKLMK